MPLKKGVGVSEEKGIIASLQIAYIKLDLEKEVDVDRITARLLIEVLKEEDKDFSVLSSLGVLDERNTIKVRLNV